MKIVKQLGPEDLEQFISLIRLFDRVFEMEPFQVPGRGHLTHLLNKKDYLVFVALEETAVTGGLIAHVLDSCYSESSEVYLYDLAVETSHQRKGTGSLLLQHLLEYCRKNGYKEMFVQADLSDKHAMDFYLKNGGQPEEVLHFNFPCE